MHRHQFLALAAAVVLQACCCLTSPCSDRPDPIDDRPMCVVHPEEPFDLDGPRPPGPGLVFGTSDFDSAGFALIKLQVEDLAVDPGDEATVTAWTGNGTEPSGTTVPPPGGTELYTTGDDVTLRHWTEHITRNYDPDEDSFWVFVHVDLDEGGGARSSRYCWFKWQPSTSTSPDTPHDFNERT